MPNLIGDALYNDLAPHYRNTLCGVKGEGGKIFPGTITNIKVAPKGKVPWFHIKTYIPEGETTSFEGVILKKSDPSLILKFPKTGFVNSGITAFYFKRIPARQWSFLPLSSPGKNWEAVNAAATLAYYGVEVVKKDKYLPHPIVIDLWNRQYLTYFDAYNAVKSGQRAAAAFHRDWAVTIDPNISTPVLSYKGNIIIGHCFENKIFVPIEARVLIESLIFAAPVEVVHE